MQRIPVERFRLAPDRPGKRIPPLSDELCELGRVAGPEALPPVVYRPPLLPSAQDELDILCGAETWRVAQALGWAEVPAIPGPEDERSQKVLLAEGYGVGGRLARIRAVIAGYEDGIPVAELAREHGIDRTLAWHWVRMRRLIPEIWEALESGEISEGHARLLSTQSAVSQAQWLSRLKRESLSVSRLRQLLRDPGSRRADPADTKSDSDLDPAVAAAIRDLEQRGTEYLGSAMVIRHQQDGSGEIRIRYADLEILQGILERMGVVEPEWD